MKGSVRDDSWFGDKVLDDFIDVEKQLRIMEKVFVPTHDHQGLARFDSKIVSLQFRTSFVETNRCKTQVVVANKKQHASLPDSIAKIGSSLLS